MIFKIHFKVFITVYWWCDVSVDVAGDAVVVDATVVLVAKPVAIGDTVDVMGKAVVVDASVDVVCDAVVVGACVGVNSG